MNSFFTAKFGYKIFTALTIALIALPVKPVFALTCTANANGNWSTPATWTGCGGGTPGAADDVRIRGQVNVTLNVASVTVKSLLINSDGNGGPSNLSLGANALTVTNGVTFNPNNNGGTDQISITSGSLSAASITINGSGNNTSHSQINITGNGTVTSTGAVTINGSTANVDNHIAVGTGTLNAGSLSITGSTGGRISQVTLSTGTVNVSGNISFAGTTANARLVYTGAGTVNLGGDLGNGGTFTASTGTINFNGSGAQSIGSYTYYNVLTSTAGTKTLSGATTVNNSISIGSGTTLDVAAVTMTLPGGATMTINGTLDMSNSTGFIQSSNSGISTLTMGANGLIRTFDATGLGPAANASLQTQGGGSWTLSNLSTVGTVEYYRNLTSGQAITDRDYNNLIVSGTTQIKTWTLAATRTINGNVTIASGAPFTLSGAQTVNVKGNWTNSGTFTAGTGTIALNGSTAQVIGGISVTTFNNLTINNANGISLSSIDATVNGILNFTNGKITTGSNRVIIGTAGSITGAGSGNYVYGNLQKNFLTGVQSFSFAIGDASTYAPVLISFANISTAGNLTASTTGSDHPQISNSSIDPAKDANRFWTLTPGGALAFSTYGATFNFVPADLDAGADTTNFIVQRLSGTWSSPTVGTLTSTSSQATGLSAFGDFSVGEKAKTTTTVDCIPNPVIVFYGTVCTATVTRVSGSTTPVGTISWSTNGSGGFSPAITCTLSGSGAFSTCSVTYTPSAVGIGSHLITASYGGDVNFRPSSGSQALTVNKADATIVITPYNVTYDGSSHTATGSATGALGESLSGLDLSGTTHTAAGVYNGDAWTFTDVTGNYNDDSGTVNDQINKANATIVVTPYNVTYDGSSHTATGSATGVLGESLSGLDLNNTTHTDAGTYNGDAWTFTDVTGNYNDDNGTVDNQINKADAAIVVTPYTVTYDGSSHTATGSVTGILGESLSGLDLSGTIHTNAGTYNGDPWTFTDVTGNYNDDNGTVNDQINKADATIVVTPYNVTYDGSSHTATGSVTGILGESLGGLDLSGTTHTNAGTYNGDLWTFADVTGNYNDDNGTVNDQIGQTSSTVIVTCPVSEVYTGSAITPCTAEATGAGMSPVDVSASLIYSNNINVGTATANASWAGDADHTSSANSSNFAITKTNVTIVVTPYNISYDGSSHTATGSATGILGESLSGLDLSGTTHTNAGTYNGDPWTFTDITGNYNDDNGTVNDQIDQASSTVTVTCPASQVYTGFAITPCTAEATGAGMGPVDVSASLVYSNNINVGAATANASWTGDANHTGNTGSGGFTIGQASSTVTVTCPASVSYTGSAQTLCTAEATGAGMSPVDVSASLVYSNNINVGTATVNASWGGDANHTGNNGSGGFTIGQAAQTITIVTSAPTSASNGSTFDVSATATSGLLVTITTTGSCSGGDTDGDATITMTSGSGACIVSYDQAGDSNYSAAPQVQESVNATEGPAFTSANNTSFDVGFPGSFTVTAIGNPSTMTIVSTGTLPTGVTFTDNGDGTALLAGTPTAGTNGTYNLVFTADNGVLPTATQNFTLTIRNGPIVVPNGVNSIPDTGNGNVSENESILDTLGITKFTVQFSQDVNDPLGNSDIKDITNPANYMLVRSTTTSFATIDCKGGVVAPDISISVDSVTYNDGTPSGTGPFVSTLSVNGSLPLNVAGFYRLYVCGTTSIVDAVNTNLILAGNGTTSGTDFQRNFQITTTATGGGGGGGGTSTASVIRVTSNFLIPVTGFAPNQITALPAQPADKIYTALGQMTIEIPTLGINFPIVGAPITDKTWDLTWLQNSVAYLEGSAYPTLPGNTVLTAHVRDAANNLGPFSDIKWMEAGQKIFIHANGLTYVYQVQENQKISPSSISKVFKHEMDDWITLLTCEDYNTKTGLYTSRRMVRAVLISVVPEK